MPYADLRELLNRLEADGDIARVPVEVETEYEIGAVTRRSADLWSPAPLFERVRGHSMPVVANLFGTRRRLATALESTPEALVEDWRTRVEQGPIPPVMVADGPCKENVLIGDAVDVRMFPAPIFNDLDGGHFITAGCHISKDPITGKRNVGIYRNQVYGPRRIGVEVAPYRHVMLHQAAAARAGERFPVAIVVGCDPAVFLASAADFPEGTDELEMAGALRCSPVQLVPCETIPLEVPATSEIVIEAEMLPNELPIEGPFGEFTGYYGIVTGRPVVEVKAVTFRNNPVYYAAYTGKPPCEDVQIGAAVKEAAIMAQVALPGLRAVHMTIGGCGYFNAVASIDKPFEGYGKMMAMAILGTWAGRTIKTLILVDADVDPYNSTEVEWALATRVQADRDVEILKQMTGVILDPSVSRADRESGASRTAKMIIDATRYDAATYEKVVVPRAEMFERVVQNWGRYAIPSGSASWTLQPVGARGEGEGMQLKESVFIPRGEGRGFKVTKGQILRIAQPEGGKQVGDFNAWNAEDPRERFWGSRTALYHGMHVTAGDQLHSTWPGERPMFTILADTVGLRATARGAIQHDVALGRCSQRYRVKRYGLETPGCQENLASAISPFGLGPEHVHDAYNVFMPTGLGPDGKFFFEESDAVEGDHVDLRAEIDCLVAISSCPGKCTGPDAKGLIAEIYEA